MGVNMSFDPFSKLKRLLNNEMDSFEVISESQKLRIIIDSSDDLSTQKYHLQKGLLEEILKSSNFYLQVMTCGSLPI